MSPISDPQLAALQGSHELLEQTLATPKRVEVPAVSVSHDPRALDAILFEPVSSTRDVHGYIRGAARAGVILLSGAVGFVLGLFVGPAL